MIYKTVIKKMDLLPDDFDGNLIKYKLPMEDLYFIQKNYKNLLLILSQNSFSDIKNVIASSETDLNCLRESMFCLLDESFPFLKSFIQKANLQNAKISEEKFGDSSIFSCSFLLCSFQISASVHYYNDDTNSYDCQITINDEAFYEMNDSLIDFYTRKKQAYTNKITALASCFKLKEKHELVMFNKFLLNLAFENLPGYETLNPEHDFFSFYKLSFI